MDLMKEIKSPILIIAIIILFGIYTDCFAKWQPDTLKVLFIGNSFTKDNGGVPDIFKDMALRTGRLVKTDAFLRNGWSIKDFIKKDSCWLKIKSRNWDYIVFQDFQGFYGDTLGVFPPDIVAYNIEFQNKIKKQCSCAKIVYVDGWEKKAGFKDKFPNDNINRLINRIMANYKYLNDQHGVGNIIAPVGLAWLRSIHQNTYISLYAPEDNRHPSHEGTYLYAAVIYALIFRSNPIKAFDVYFKDMSGEDAQFLCDIAFNSVKDTLSYTNLESYSIKIKVHGNLMFAPIGYHHYQWFKNDTLMKGATSFFLKRERNDAIYTLHAKNWKGCMMESIEFKNQLQSN